VTWLRARVPLCAAHTYHWSWRLAVVLTSLAVVIALGIAAIFLMAELERVSRPPASDMAAKMARFSRAAYACGGTA